MGNDKFSIDFSTSLFNSKHQREHTWHHKEFGKELVLTLRDVGVLPPQSLKESVEMIKKNEKLEATVEELTKRLAAYEQNKQ